MPTKSDGARGSSFPDGFAVRLATDVVWKRADQTLLGGEPLRHAALSSEGARIVEEFREGVPFGRVGASRPAKSILLRYLLDNGLVEPAAEALPPGPECEIVIPARNRAAQVARLVGDLKDFRNVVVVDDGSTDDTAAAAGAMGAKVVSHARCEGPAAARNTGLRHTSHELVAFVDSDCIVAPGTLERLERQFLDERIAAVAPRVGLAVAGASAIVGKYEETNGSEDLGPLGGLVGPGKRIPYVPTVMLLARRSALESVGGFAGTMRAGEDVDLIWRLVSNGWLVRYSPEDRVGHDHRRSLGAWLVRKFIYGSAAADIDLRHRGALAGPKISPASLLLVVAMATFLPGGALVLAAALLSTRRGASTLVSLVGNFARAVDGLLSAAIRLWLPALLVLLAWQPVNGAIVVALVALRYAGDHRSRGGRLHLPIHLAVRFLDEAFYCCGVWIGCLRVGNFRPLLPRFDSARLLSKRRRKRQGPD